MQLTVTSFCCGFHVALKICALGHSLSGETIIVIIMNVCIVMCILDLWKPSFGAQCFSVN